MITFNKMNEKTIMEIAKEHKLQLLPTIGLDKKYTFGIEIEFENAPLDSIKNTGHWMLEDETVISKPTIDHTCGGELISPILTDNSDSWADISDKCRKLVKSGATITEYTGGHIHIGSQIIGENPDNIRVFLKMWELFENVIYRFSYGYENRERLGMEMYASPIGTKLKKLRNSRSGYKTFQSFYYWINYFRTQQATKFEGISFKNFRGCEEDLGNTIEIRCPNGTLNPIIWQNNINFFTRLLLKSRVDQVDEQFLDYLLGRKKSSEYDFQNFEMLDIEQVVLLSNMIYDNEVDQLSFLKQCLKAFTKEEKSKNQSL